MTKDTQTQQNPLESTENRLKYSYYFICACGCGQVSENLGKEYIRLRKNQKWIAKDCKLEDQTVIREFKGGILVSQDDF